MSVTYPSIQIQLSLTEYVNFSRQEIISANVIDEIDAIGIAMPVSTLTFKVSRSANTLSMFDGTLYARLAERLPVFCYEYIDAVNHLVGKFYLDTWKNVSATEVEFTAIDVIGILADTDFDGIFWSAETSLYTALSQILDPINILFSIDNSLTATTVSGWIPPGTYRDALQQICFAVGAMASTSQSEVLRILPAAIPALLYSNKINTKQAKQLSIELSAIVARIELVSHNYTQSLVTEVIFDQLLPAGEHKIIFEKPYYNIVIDGLGYTQVVLATQNGDYVGTQNGDYLEAGGEYNFGTNSVYIYLSASATITITGTLWIDSKRSFIFNEDILNTKNKITLNIADATLINSTRGQATLDRLRDYYRQRYIQKVLLLPSTIKTGDIVLSDTLEEKKILAIVKNMSLNLAGGFLSTVELRGFLPAYILPVANPTRRARTGFAVSGSDMTFNNRWRQYA